MLKPLAEQIIQTSETIMVGQITDRAKRALLPGEIISDLKKSAEWNPVAKRIIETSAPAVAAKWMNKSGISAEYQMEIALGTAVCSIMAGHVMLLKRMDELIRKVNPPSNQGPPPVPEKKEAAKP